MNNLRQYATSFFVDRKVTTTKNATSGVEPSITMEPVTTTTQK